MDTTKCQSHYELLYMLGYTKMTIYLVLKCALLLFVFQILSFLHILEYKEVCIEIVHVCSVHPWLPTILFQNFLEL
jgi:hypothetical protein